MTATTAPAPAARATPTLTGAQKLMIVVLSMTVFGLSDLVAEIIPSFEFGPFQLELSYFAFIPVVLAALFSPIWVALGAALGKLVFAELMLGDFSGFGEIEGFLQLVVGIWVAGTLVRDPRKPTQLFWAALAFVGVDKVTSGLIDLLKVAVGIDPDALDEADGLFSAVLLAESIELLVALVITGVLFGALPAMWLAPRLYGKIEPLMGIRPRDPQNPPRFLAKGGASFWALGIAGIVLAVGAGVFSQYEEFVESETPISTIGEVNVEDHVEDATEEELEDAYTQECVAELGEPADGEAEAEEALDECVGDKLDDASAAAYEPVFWGLWTTGIVTTAVVLAVVIALIVVVSRRRRAAVADAQADVVELTADGPKEN